ncbi:MAG: hypothetical protein H6819_12730 [Phycisphaerales bacterium]|nr:hypothetical protein [Phycisphaerales bacterium]MCB9856672.1 hypothetical protein [Phycisphaerales bacterium]MCB9862201.1 hypothetical protein [Phycisphaerales bacterium]
MDFRNTTHVDSAELLSAIRQAIDIWPSEKLIVRVRYSRGAEFSGTCYYASNRIFVNLGRHNKYPYRLLTHIARPRANQTHWWRELYSVEIGSPLQLVLFVFLHEFYHWLVKQARRNVRQKEGRCDRFATRVLVDQYGAQVRDSRGRIVQRDAWDFQDLNGFVAAALRKRTPRQPQQLLLPNAAATKPARSLQTAGENGCAA